MKQTITIALLLCSIGVFAQTKHLPKEVVIKMSDAEYIQFYRKIDSLMTITQNTSSEPSNVLSPFLQRFGKAWMDIDRKVALQMVVDTPKKK
jgi:hypothetical protein